MCSLRARGMQLPSPSVCPRRSATAARRLAIVTRSRARRGPPCPRAVRKRGPGAEVGAALPRGCERDLPPGFALSPFGSSEVLAPRAPVRRGLLAIRALRCRATRLQAADTAQDGCVAVGGHLDRGP